MSNIKSNSQLTSLNGLALMLDNALKFHGYDSQAMFREAGFDYNELKDPLGRFPTHRLATVWDRALEASGDPTFGLTVAQYFTASSLNSLSCAITKPETDKSIGEFDEGSNSKESSRFGCPQTVASAGIRLLSE